MSKIEEQTSVQNVEIDIDDILAMPGAESVMTPGEGAAPEKKPNVFSSMDVDTTFLDRPDDEPTGGDDTPPAGGEGDDNPEKKKPVAGKPDTSFLNPDADEDEPGDDDEKNKGGRPTAMVTAAKNLIKEGILKPFLNDKGEEEDITSYTAEDFQELIKANLENQQNSATEEVATQFFQSLPPEMQQAYEYLANGGTDMKGMFQALASSTEMRSLDISNVGGQKQAIRAYLQATNYGTPEEIEDEIYSLEDRGELEKKAKQFKPKLDAMSEHIVKQKVAAQEAQARQRAEQSQKYIESVYSTLEKGDLNGLNLDNRTQNMLYAGLVQSNYPSISGKQTNMLGHLLEKYQWVEPRHDLIAEALWLLADPDGYKNNISSNVSQKKDKETLRTLKTEQSTKSSGSVQEDNSSATRKRATGIPKPRRNFFGRQ